MTIDPKALRICVVGVLLGLGLALLQQSGAFSAMTGRCVTDAEFAAVIGPQIRQGLSSVDTGSFGGRPLCSGMEVTKAVSNLSLRHVPPGAASAYAKGSVAPPPDTPGEAIALTKLVTGTWESTVIGDEPDPGRCVSTAKNQENSITAFLPSGKYAYSHQEGDSTGKWRIVQGQLEIDLPGSKGLWRVRKLTDDHIILSSKVPYVSSERLRRCRWNADQALVSESDDSAKPKRKSTAAEPEEDDPMAEQRCVWSCLANSRGATDPAYNQCVNTNCFGASAANAGEH